VQGCGMAVNHTLQPYPCGPEPGCPACPAGYSCADHTCSALFNLTAQVTNLSVGSNATVFITKGNRPCSLCEVTWTSPSGLTGTGTADSNGVFTLSLNETGNYTFRLVSDPSRFTVVQVSAAAPTPVTSPFSDIGDCWPCILGLAVLFVILLLLALKRRKRKKEPVEGKAASGSAASAAKPK
jgi:hypothetical protein